MTWSSADGDVDRYEVQLLYNDMKVLPSITLSNTATEYRFTSLIPGRLYKIVVLTFSGDAQRSTFVEGLTGRNFLQVNLSYYQPYNRSYSV